MRAGPSAVEERRGDEVVHRAVGQCAAALGLGDRLLDEAAVVRLDPGIVEIGAVDGKARDDLDEGPAKRVDGVVARVPVAVGDALQVGDEHLELAGEARLEDLGSWRARRSAP